MSRISRDNASSRLVSSPALLCPLQHTCTHTHTTDSTQQTEYTQQTAHNRLNTHNTQCTCLVLILVVLSVSDQAIVVGGGLAGISMRGGTKKPNLTKLLCESSRADVEWLLDKFKLGSVSGCTPWWSFSTHRAKERFPDMTFTYALIHVEKIGERSSSRLV